MKIIALGASYSKSSINKQFAAFAAAQFEGADTEVLDLNNYPLPLFTIEAEKESGHPEAAKSFVEKLAEADLIIISMAEHNGSYSAGFKNLFDWSSRVKLKMFEGKKVFLLSTAPGPWGGKTVLETAKNRFPRHEADIVATFSLPSFGNNFSPEDGITDPDLKADFNKAIAEVKQRLA